MARTWTLAATETIVDLLCFSTPINDDADTVYLASSSTSTPKVYSWDGSTFSDISGTYFYADTSPHAIYSLCWFKSNLYAHHRNETGSDNTNDHHVSVWGGGTSWSVARSVVNNSGTNARSDPTDRRTMACDDNIIVVYAPDVGGNSAINSSTDGSSWVVDQWQSAYNDANDMFYGLESLSRYSEVIGFEDTGDVLATRVGSDWQEVSPGLSTGHYLLGHDGDYLYYRDSGSPHTIYRTGDWNATQSALSTTHASAPGEVKCVGRDAIMLRVGLTQTAYTLSGGDFVADGTVGSGNIYSYFRLGTTIYAVTGASNTARFYSGGTITPFGTAVYALTHSADGIPGSILV